MDPAIGVPVIINIEGVMLEMSKNVNHIKYLCTVHFNCPLPVEAGDLVTRFGIMFKSRVAAQLFTELRNKTDARSYHGYKYGGIVSDTAYNVVPL